MSWRLSPRCFPSFLAHSFMIIDAFLRIAMTVTYGKSVSI
jgi:hypothetical protein